MIKSILLGRASALERVYSQEILGTLEAEAGLDRQGISYEALAAENQAKPEVQYIFSTWGMPPLTEEEITAWFPNLKAVFYAAGSVQGFAEPFLRLGIKVCSAYGANAIPVAEYTVSQILLANKGYYQAARYYSQGQIDKARQYASAFPGNYGNSVGLIGMGMIGRLVNRTLRRHHLEVWVFDPYLTEKEASILGVRLCTLEELFSNCQTISNHAPNKAQNKGMLHYGLFARMANNGTFINTGRGAQVVEEDLIRILQERPDMTALLDVTDPEPPDTDSPLFQLPNAILTPHIAGSTGREVERLAQYMLQEFRHYQMGEQLQYEITAAMLPVIA